MTNRIIKYNLQQTRQLILLFLTLFPALIFAYVRPAALYTEHMVLQRNTTIPIWGTAKPGENVTVSLNNTVITETTDANGKWKINFPKQKAGGPYSMEIFGENIIKFNDIYIGEVWLCSGQSNMDMTVAKEDRYWCGVNNEESEVANANYPEIRVFDVDYTPAQQIKNDVVGKWEVISPKTVGHLSAVAYFFARDLYKKMNIPVGLITSAYGASTAETWISKTALEAKPNLKPILENYNQKWNTFIADSIKTMKDYREAVSKFQGDMALIQASAGDVTAKKPKAPRNPNPSLDQHNPFVCYNGMIAPLIPYAIKGALWYQGESNGPTANNYREIMETLIEDWRTKWNQGDFPFLYVQLANYGKAMQKPVENSSMMMVREAQSQNLSIPNTAMVVAIENAGDEPNNIHPKNKQDIGNRLSLAARAIAYNEKVEYSGPVYKSFKTKKNKIILSFKHVGKALVAKNDTLSGFAICGEDRKWVWANAEIKGKKVSVSSAEVSKPFAVRYCWGTNPPASLLNKAGLWTPHFRTDNF